jgi:hypothetical protein
MAEWRRVSIVEALDMGKYVTGGFCPCCIAPVMDELGLEDVKEAFHRGIVNSSQLCDRKPAGCISLRYSAEAYWWIRPRRPPCRNGHRQGRQWQVSA